MFENFKISKFIITLNPLEEIILPQYKGSTFRGAFGNVFRRVVCINKKSDCIGCFLKEKCIYSYIFETPLPKNSEYQKKNSYVPHPFIIEPPLENKEIYNKGETISFNLTLINKAISYLPYIIFTFKEMGENGIGKGRGKYFLKTVKNCNNNEIKMSKTDNKIDKVNRKVNHIIYDGENKTFHNNYVILTGEEIFAQADNHLDNNNLTIEFITPTRIKYNGKLISSIEFYIFIKNLLRRISALSYFHSKEQLDLDYRNLIDKAKNIKVNKSELYWYDWTRYSARQDSKMRLGGFKGKINFVDAESCQTIKDFLPLVILGEYVHIGRGTSFGLGKYKIL
jgi:hypothetical protein